MESPPGKPLGERATDLIPVSLMLVGLLKAVEGISRVELMLDEMLALAATLFLLTLLLTHVATRRPGPPNRTATRLGLYSYDAGLVVLFGAAVVLAFGLL